MSNNPLKHPLQYQLLGPPVLLYHNHHKRERTNAQAWSEARDLRAHRKRDIDYLMENSDKLKTLSNKAFLGGVNKSSSSSSSLLNEEIWDPQALVYNLKNPFKETFNLSTHRERNFQCELRRKRENIKWNGNGLCWSKVGDPNFLGDRRTFLLHVHGECMNEVACSEFSWSLDSNEMMNCDHKWFLPTVSVEKYNTKPIRHIEPCGINSEYPGVEFYVAHTDQAWSILKLDRSNIYSDEYTTFENIYTANLSANITVKDYTGYDNIGGFAAPTFAFLTSDNTVQQAIYSGHHTICNTFNNFQGKNLNALEYTHHIMSLWISDFDDNSLLQFDMRSNKSYKHWDLKKIEYRNDSQVENILQDPKKSHTVYVHTSPAGKIYELDQRMPLKEVCVFNLPSIYEGNLSSNGCERKIMDVIRVSRNGQRTDFDNILLVANKAEDDSGFYFCQSPKVQMPFTLLPMESGPEQGDVGFPVSQTSRVLLPFDGWCCGLGGVVLNDFERSVSVVKGDDVTAGTADDLIAVATLTSHGDIFLQYFTTETVIPKNQTSAEPNNINVNDLCLGTSYLTKDNNGLSAKLFASPLLTKNLQLVDQLLQRRRERRPRVDVPVARIVKYTPKWVLYLQDLHKKNFDNMKRKGLNCSSVGDEAMLDVSLHDSSDDSDRNIVNFDDANLITYVGCKEGDVKKKPIIHHSEGRTMNFLIKDKNNKLVAKPGDDIMLSTDYTTVRMKQPELKGQEAWKKIQIDNNGLTDLSLSHIANFETLFNNLKFES